MPKPKTVHRGTLRPGTPPPGDAVPTMRDAMRALRLYVQGRSVYVAKIPLQKEHRILVGRDQLIARISNIVGPGEYEAYPVLPLEQAVEAFVEGLAHLSVADGRLWGLAFPEDGS